MTVKEEVLSCLEKNRDRYLSGEEMAESLGVTRASVWKAVQNLREEGYRIKAVTNRGYRLTDRKDVLTAAGIAAALQYGDPEKLHVYGETDSTNTRLRLMAHEGAPHGTIAVADRQTAGRGRMGRSFISPPGSGIYLSILIRPDTDLAGALPVTGAAAVAVCEAIRELTGKEAGIKWVNDIYLGTKKICGILTEAETSFETGGLDSVVIGIGVNFRSDPGSFPEDVIGRIGWIYEEEEKSVSRNEMAAAIIDRTLYYTDHLQERNYIEPYKEYSVIIGRDIVCTRGNERFEAKALGIDDNGGLIVDTEEGRRVLSSGEITVRWKAGPQGTPAER